MDDASDFEIEVSIACCQVFGGQMIVGGEYNVGRARKLISALAMRGLKIEQTKTPAE